jgi:hypothetical protein
VWARDAAGKWTALKTSTALVPRRYHVAAVIGGELILALGDGGDGSTRAVERVDLATGAVRAGTPSPFTAGFAGGAVHDGRLWVAGGHADGHWSARVDVYDPAADRWEPGPPLSVAHDARLVDVDGRLYALGGFAGQKNPDTPVVERLAVDGRRWERVAEMSVASSAFGAGGLDGHVYTFGDYDALGRVLAFDPAADAWTSVAVPYTPRRHDAVVTVGHELLVMGGNVASSGSWLDTLEVYGHRDADGKACSP